MQAVQFSEEFDLDIYNGLVSVGKADETVRQDERLSDFLEAASKIFLSHRMESRFGVSLLHKHNPCAPGEHMIEYKDAFNESAVLITRPVSKTPREEGAVPTVWALSNGRFVPLEYSTDPAAVSLCPRGDVPSEFLDEFAALQKSSPIGELVGLAIVSRKFYDAAKPNETPLEYSNLVERSNVVFLRDRSASEGKSIETAWRFTAGTGTMGKTCLDTRECVMQCHKTNPGGTGHDAKTHQQTPAQHIEG